MVAEVVLNVDVRAKYLAPKMENFKENFSQCS